VQLDLKKGDELSGRTWQNISEAVAALQSGGDGFG
jgi:hypothetical protein